MLEKVPARLRGELTRWMLEPRTGVFVGTISAMVREKLWAKVEHLAGEGSAMLIYRAQNEQGFAIRVHGDPKRTIWEAEGLYLVRCPSSG
jgi:CRISPR-associated protein Cas2